MNEKIRVRLPEAEIRAYCKTQPIARLSLFGSALRGELEADSDIDLLVEYEDGARISLLDLSGHMLDLSDIVGRPVDLTTPKSLSPYFRDEVIESAIVIYAQEKEKRLRI